MSGRAGADYLSGADLNALKMYSLNVSILSAGRHGRILRQVIVIVGDMRPE